VTALLQKALVMDQTPADELRGGDGSKTAISAKLTYFGKGIKSLQAFNTKVTRLLNVHDEEFSTTVCCCHNYITQKLLRMLFVNFSAAKAPTRRRISQCSCATFAEYWKKL